VTDLQIYLLIAPLALAAFLGGAAWLFIKYF